MRENIKFIFFSVFAYLAQFIIANIYYCDDLFRSVWGYSGWSQDGRPFADWFYSAILRLHNETIPDVFPLPLIISSCIFCLTFSKVLENCKFKNEGHSFFIALIFIANPFFISNLMFRYDGAFMLLALSMSVLPFAFHCNSLSKWFVVSVACLTCTFCLYQASVNIYIGIVALFALYRAIDLEKTKNVLLYIFISAASLLLSYFIYSKIILNIYETHAYFSNFNQTIPPTIEGLKIALRNMELASVNILMALKSGLLYPLIISYAIATFYVAKHSLTNRAGLVVVVYIVALFVSLFSSVGVIIFGVSPAYYARVFIGVSVALSFPIFVIYKLEDNKFIRITSSVIISIPLLCISSAAINASKQEVTYHDMVADRIISDIYRENATNNKKIAILGALPSSPRASINTRVYPIISLIIPQIFNGGYDGGRFTLMNRGIGEVAFVTPEELQKITVLINKSNQFSETNLYRLYDIHGVTVIQFK